MVGSEMIRFLKELRNLSTHISGEFITVVTTLIYTFSSRSWLSCRRFISCGDTVSDTAGARSPRQSPAERSASRGCALMLSRAGGGKYVPSGVGDESWRMQERRAVSRVVGHGPPTLGFMAGW